MMTNEIVAGLVVAGLPRWASDMWNRLNGRLDNFFCKGWEYYVSPICAAK